MPRQAFTRQAYFPEIDALAMVADELAAGDEDERGAIFTKPSIVEFMLDLMGYKPKRCILNQRILEPAFGHGSFLIPAVRRLLAAWKKRGSGDPLELSECVFGVELHKESFDYVAHQLTTILKHHGVTDKSANALIGKWLVRDDYLLTNIPHSFDFIVGNPPYIRIERIPAQLMKEYRRRYKTMFDRADIYVPFIERSLDLLLPGGTLAFICADRWMKNKYGGPLRKKIAEQFHLQALIDMNHVDAFDSEVSAYPAISVIANAPPGETSVLKVTDCSDNALSTLAKRFLKGTQAGVTYKGRLVNDSLPWVVTNCNSSRLLRHLEEHFPLIEDAGCKVGIGVATGADRIFIGPFEELDVEIERKLPLATTKDIDTGVVKWRGLGVLNPFEDDGKPVDLSNYPKFANYMERHKEQLSARHIAKKTSNNWYRTIDRIHPLLTYTPKLLIPDIKGEANVVVEHGKLYPHHNLYYIATTDWDIQALQLVLSTGVAHLFVSQYSTKMRGGYLRFQAQHLRRIRIPRWADLSLSVKNQLFSAVKAESKSNLTDLIAALYQLTPAQRDTLHLHSKAIA